LKQNFEIFRKGLLTPENLIFRGFGVAYICGTRATTLAFRPTANLIIAPHSRRARNASCVLSDLFRTTYRFQDTGVQSHL